MNGANEERKCSVVGLPLALAAAGVASDASVQSGMHIRLGQEWLRQGDLAKALGHFIRATQLEPTSVAAWCGIGTTMNDRDHFDRALAAYGRAVELNSADPQLHYQLARTYLRAERLPEAEASLRQALQLAPDLATAWSALGVVEEMRGNLTQAIAHKRQAIELDPTLAEAYAGLPVTGDGALTEQEVDQLERLLVEQEPAASAAISLHFVLVHYHDRQGNYERAFAHAVQGNEYCRAEFARVGRSYDVGIHQRSIDHVLRVFDEPFFARLAGGGSASRLPIFIVGLPRSGTTLLEQVLSSHPRVEGGGEANDLLGVLLALPEVIGQPQANALDCLADLEATHCAQLAERHLNLMHERAAGAAHITNKAPSNFPLVGLIWALFPEAALLACRRDPRDVALSCFFTELRRIPWSCDLQYIASVIQDHARVMAHWQRVLPAPMLEIRYEDMVADCETVSRRAIAHCGLDWDERCLAFHENRRPVLNMSRRQVRRPIYQESVGRWRHYQSQLEPILAAFGPG